MFKERKMRDVVENHLFTVDELLAFAKKHDCKEAITSYTAQKVALEAILMEFSRLGVKSK